MGLLAAVLLFFGACDSGDDENDLSSQREGRGKTLELIEVAEHSIEDINATLEEAGVTVTQAKNAVKVYKMVYETIDWDGETTQASGALMVPIGKFSPHDIISVQRGTILQDDEAPSVSQDTRFIGLVFAMEGYLTVMPDLLGLGDSPGFHPYHHGASTATAVVDMLRAAEDFAAEQEISLTGKLFLTGYSQGGYTAMAAHRIIEEEYSDEFQVTASAPMAGAYDLSGTMVDVMLSGDPYPAPFYLPYFLLAYNEVYDIFESPSDFLASPYDQTIPSLFDGEHGSGEINGQLPGTLREIINPDLAAELDQNSSHPLLDFVKQNDMYDWTPQAPVKLYHCSGDSHVPIQNSEVALAWMMSGSASVELVEPVGRGRS